MIKEDSLSDNRFKLKTHDKYGGEIMKFFF